MSDEEFLRALESCTLSAAEFDHAAHVRAAYLYLSKDGPSEALGNIRRSLQRYVAHLGKAERYDEAMTAAYMKLIQQRIAERGDAGGWSGFARSNPDLLATRLRGDPGSRPRPLMLG